VEFDLSLERTWTKEEIVAVLQRESFGYQNIDLPYGLETGGVDRSATAKTIFSEMSAGKSVFDLGCRFGYFCFSAEEQGAVDILGTDVDPDNIRKSRLLSEIRQSKARFETFNIERDRIERRFDYVLCLNVLHHLRNPLSAIDKLIAATREVLVLEVAGFSLRDRRHNHLLLPVTALLSRLPLFYVARKSTQTFFISLEAIKVMLLEKRADFARVDVVRTGPKGRPIIFAHRRRIDNLLIVAGLPASGKSTLISHLQSDHGQSLASKIGAKDIADWRALKFGALDQDREPSMGNVIVHYNISKHLIDGDIYLHINALADLMSVAEKVTIVTLATPRNRLLEQFKKFRAYKADEMFSSKRTRKKTKRLLDLFQNPVALNELYTDWFRFVEETGKQAYLVTHDGAGYELSQKQHLIDY
jgi:SAM-dependent methyltransferase